MPIKRSSGDAVARLLAVLAQDESGREGAIARLAIIGTRAVPQLIACASGAAATGVRCGALEALATIDDGRVLPALVQHVDDPDPVVASAAVAALQLRLDAFPASTAAHDAFHHLTRVVLDQARMTSVRLTALDALQARRDPTLGPVLARLTTDPDPAISQRAAAGPPASADDELDAVAAGRRAAHPGVVRRLLEQGGRTAPLVTLRHLLDVVGAKERAARSSDRRTAWMATRAAVHAVLAMRGSRIALSDLHATLRQADRPLPEAFLAAAARVGDVTCLEALAAAYSTSNEPVVGLWRRQLVDTFVDIVRREGLTRRHRDLRRVLARWPAIARAMPKRL